MNKIVVLAVVLAVAWHGYHLYEQNDLPFIANLASYSGLAQEEKCFTEDGRVLYGTVPRGTVCARRESVEGSLTIVSSDTFSSNEEPLSSGSRFRCDGRQYCSQMNSRAEAEYFLRHCPNTKMDGDHDGVPCENDSRF